MQVMHKRLQNCKMHPGKKNWRCSEHGCPKFWSPRLPDSQAAGASDSCWGPTPSPLAAHCLTNIKAFMLQMTHLSCASQNSAQKIDCGLWTRTNARLLYWSQGDSPGNIKQRDKHCLAKHSWYFSLFIYGKLTFRQSLIFFRPILTEIT